MKRTCLFLLSAMFVVLACFAKSSHLLDFPETSFDFGTITDQSAPVEHYYQFTNTSDQTVAVLSVSTGCGCTRPEYPLKPLAPGESAQIKITFLPEGQKGEINKSIQVRYRAAKASSAKRITLRLKGMVIPDTN